MGTLEGQASNAAGNGNELPHDPDALRVRGVLPCPLAQAWDFATVPGWFINDNALREHSIVSPEPGKHLVTDPVYGEFEFTDLEVVPLKRYAFKAAHTGGDTGGPATVTTFEFREEDGGTELIISETGFALLGLEPQETREAIDANVRAWVLELRLAAQALA